MFSAERGEDVRECGGAAADGRVRNQLRIPDADAQDAHWLAWGQSQAVRRWPTSCKQDSFHFLFSMHQSFQIKMTAARDYMEKLTHRVFQDSIKVGCLSEWIDWMNGVVCSNCTRRRKVWPTGNSDLSSGIFSRWSTFKVPLFSNLYRQFRSEAHSPFYFIFFKLAITVP